MAEKDLASYINHTLEYKLDPILKGESGREIRLTEYQFLSTSFFLGEKVRSLLLYWEPGFGKTLACIATIKNIFNVYPNWSIMLFVQSQLVKDPWLDNIKEFIPQFEQNITIIKYDIMTPEEIIHKHRFIPELDRVFYIFDEVHNFIKPCIPSDNREKKFVKNKKFFKFICDNVSKTNNKLLAMSATPVHNNKEEFIYLLHFLRPYSFKLNDEIFSQEGNIIYPNILQRSIWGLSSVQRRSPIDVFVQTQPSPDGKFAGRKINIVNLKMSAFQTARYQQARTFEQRLSTRALRSFTLRAATLALVYTNIDDKKQINEQLKEFKEELSHISFNEKQIQDFKEGRIVGDTCLQYNFQLLPIDPMKVVVDEDFESNILFLNNYSCKYMKICHTILNANGKCVIYEPFVSFAGINTMKLYLDKFNISYIEYTQNTTKNRSSLVEDFNADDNIHGEKIKVCLISLAGEVGITFKDVVKFIFACVPWSDLQQIMGRALRYNPNARSGIKMLDVDILVAKTDDVDEFSVDQELLDIIAKKEFSKRQIYDQLLFTSIDRVHVSNMYEEPSILSTETWLTVPYKISDKKAYVDVPMYLTPIYYSFDPNFSSYYSGFLDKKTSYVYVKNEILGELVYDNQVPIFKIINSVLVFLIQRRTEEQKG